MSKNDKKWWFLMAKSSFWLKSTIIDQKTVKNSEKLTHFNDTKIGHNLTTKRGDSGSAGILERKCVIIEAPNLDTKSDKKWCQQLKMTKNDQKSVKHKNSKKWKIRKSEKVTKSENHKSDKMVKM